MILYFFLSVLLVNAHYSYAGGKMNQNSVKTMIIREIMKKVSNITLNSLSKIPDEKKNLVLNKIELKLKKTAQGLSDGQKYVKFIMQEFKNKAYGKKKNPTVADKERNAEEIKEKENVLRTKKGVNITTEKTSLNHNKFNSEAKKTIIIDIANKIESMARSYIKDSQTFDQKKKILKKIERRILESSRRKHTQLHDQHTELKAYTDLITQGLEVSIRRLLPKTRRTGDSETTETDILNDFAKNDTHAINMKHIDQYKKFFSEIWSETSLDPLCTDMVEEICLRIESLHKVSCGDGKIIALDQLCDGVSHCWNDADETNCTEKATEKIYRAIELMTDIDKSITSKCLQPVIDGVIFSHHHGVLLNMLKSQLNYILNHKPSKINFNLSEILQEEENIFMKKTIADTSMTISSLSYALELNLCSPHDKIADDNKITSNRTRKSMNPDPEEFIDDEDTKSEWSPMSCTCKKENCKSDDCDARCKRICWQKYSLNHLACQSVTGGASISLDLICDGKLDCFDESDESTCTEDSSKTKYEANTIFNDILEILALKSLSVEYGQSRNKLVALTGLVRQLQKLTTVSNVDVHTVKILRDEYFKMLVHVYGDMLHNTNLEELDNSYDLLVLLNEKMIDALKRSHVGNDNVIPSAGCYCRNGTCALLRCSRKCIDTCEVEPLLTKYACSASNTSVHIKLVCNGKKDCPDGEDEKDCKQDVCRSHYLILLRHNLQNIGVTFKGTALGEVLDAWKAKVSASLKITEGRERPNHKVMEDTVITLLHDLVKAYASLEDIRKNRAEHILKEFINVADMVKETLKSCGQ